MGYVVAQLPIGGFHTATDDRDMVGRMLVDEVREIHRTLEPPTYNRSSEMTPAVRINTNRSARVSVVAGRMCSS